MRFTELWLTRLFRLPARRWGLRLAEAGTALVAGSGPVLGQTTAHWTAGTGNWATAANWDTNPYYPNNGTPAGATYNAFLDGLNGNIAYMVNVDSDVAVSALTIAATPATLSQIGGVFQTTTGTITAGTYLINGGTIQGGTWNITGTGKMAFGTSSASVLSGVTFTGTGGLDLSAMGSYVRLQNVTFAPGTPLSIGTNAALGSQSKLSNVLVTLNSNSYLAVEGSMLVTLVGTTVSQAPDTHGYVGASKNFAGTGNLSNQGTIQSLNANGILTVNPTGYFYNGGTGATGDTGFGTLKAGGGGELIISPGGFFINTVYGSIVASGGGTITINPSGMFTNAYDIQATGASSVVTISPGGNFWNASASIVSATDGGTVTINPGGAVSPNWDNYSGTLRVTNGTLNLGGNVTTSNLGTIIRTGGTINLTGGLDNTSATLALKPSFPGFGSLRLDGGTITGGSVTTVAGSGAVLAAAGNSANQLSGVSLGIDSGTGSSVLDLSGTAAYAHLTNGTTFAAGSKLTVGPGGGLGIGQAQVVNNVSVTLGDNSFVAVEGATSATLGPAVVVSQAASTSGQIGANYFVSGTGNLTNQGTIQANAAVAVVSVNPSGTLSNTGTLLAGNGGTVSVPAATTLTNFSAGTLTGGSYVVQGNSTMNFNGRAITTIGTGTTVTLDGAGSVFTSVDTVTTNAGTFNLLNGRAFTVTGGTLANTGSLQVGTSAVLVGNVQATGGKVFGNGTIPGNVTFTGTGNTLQGGPSPGNLTVTGNLTLNAGTTYAARLDGPTPGTQHDRVTVAGAANVVTIAGSTLDLSLGYDPAANQLLYIIDNPTNNPVNGSFANLPTGGSSVQLTNPSTGHVFLATVFYAADTSTASLTGGNDVVLQFVPVPEPVSLLVLGVVGTSVSLLRRWPTQRRS